MLRSGIWATKDDTSPDRLMRTGVEPENREYKAFADLKSCWQRVCRSHGCTIDFPSCLLDTRPQRKAL